MVAAMRLCSAVLLVGVAAATPVRNQTEQSQCTQLAAPQNVTAVFWKSSPLSSRRVTAYEFAATWDRVHGAQDYTICYTQDTKSRLGQFTHAYERCVTQKGTKLNKGFVFYNNDGELSVRVRANGKDRCQSSDFTDAVANDTLAGVSMVCTDVKVQNQLAYNGPSRNPFASTGATRSGRVVISNVTRTVGAKGTTENLVTVAWKGDPAVSNSPTSDPVLEICAGVTRYWTSEDQAARTTYTCTYALGTNATGSASIKLDVTDPRAVYLDAYVRVVGLCTDDSVDADNKVTIADYMKIKVMNPIASTANGVTDLEQSSALYPKGFHIVTTSRTTPDATIDVNYYESTLVGMMDTWELPVRTTPDGIIVHDTFITRTEGVVTLVSSHAGPDNSIAISLYDGEGATATALTFDSLQPDQKPPPDTHFKFTPNGNNTQIESVAQKGMCMTQDASNDEFQPPFILKACLAKEKTQKYRFQPFVVGWMADGSQWVYTYNTETPDLSFWKRA